MAKEYRPCTCLVGPDSIRWSPTCLLHSETAQLDEAFAVATPATAQPLTAEIRDVLAELRGRAGRRSDDMRGTIDRLEAVVTATVRAAWEERDAAIGREGEYARNLDTAVARSKSHFDDAAILRDGLSFYAERQNYILGGPDSAHVTLRDRGEVARKALARVDRRKG